MDDVLATEDVDLEGGALDVGLAGVERTDEPGLVEIAVLLFRVDEGLLQLARLLLCEFEQLPSDNAACFAT